ncbi:MAG: hypothetical protein KGQ26_02280 [Rhodospirillales bacterium]|nr:hypothetical protein [Rhodospirillales bacterium]MDE2318802.1 hypothetical protein [Rhodospirillales bacterium]
MKNTKILIMPLTFAGAFSIFMLPAAASTLSSGLDTSASSAIVSSLGASPVSSAQLSKMRAGFGVVGAVNLGIDTGNSANNSLTGSISTGQSVNGNTGLTTVIQNTGNNSLLQSSMTVNITVH